MTARSTIPRRALLAGSVAALATGCGGSGAHSKHVLRVTLANHGWTDHIKKLIPEFEERSGLKVETSTFGEDQLSAQYNVKLNASGKDIDVMMYRPPVEHKLFADNGWLEDITDRVQSDKTWDWGDFGKNDRKSVTFKKRVQGVPLVTEQQVLYYRKDVLEDEGLAVPTTLDALEETAAKLFRPDKQFYGYVARGRQSSQWVPILHSFGGDFLDEQGNAALNTPEAVAADDWYGRILHSTGPPGVNSMGWTEALAIFAQGKVAFYLDANVLHEGITDPEKSAVADKVGFAMLPAGPAGARPYSATSWGLAINSSSQNKDNAWEFIRWATSKELTLSAQQKGQLGARQSVWKNDASMTGIPKQLGDVTREAVALDAGTYGAPVLQANRASEIYLQPVTAAVNGQLAEPVADDANPKFQKLLDRERKWLS
jgi:multiple sugar transport system substrate-binding protein